MLSVIFVISSTVIWSYLTSIAGYIAPNLILASLHIKTLPLLSEITPRLTLLAIEFWGLWPITICLATIIFIILLFRAVRPFFPLCVVMLSIHLLIVWIAAFCLMQISFQGPSCLHHGPEFDFIEFIKFYFGIFPATLISILVTLIASIRALTSKPLNCSAKS